MISGLFAATDVNAIVPYRVRLNFDASFFGNDRLRIRLQARDANLVDNQLQLGFGSTSAPGSNIALSKLFYRFQAFDERVTFFAGLQGVNPDDYFTYGSPLNGVFIADDLTPGFTQDFGRISQFDTGARRNTSSFGFNWQATEWLSVAYGFTSFESTDSTSRNAPGQFVQSGVFEGPHANSVELAFTPTESILLALAYTNYQDGSGAFGRLSNNVLTNGVANSTIFTTGSADAFSVALNWEITPRVIFTGFYETIDGSITRTNLVNGAVTAGDFDEDFWLVGFAFPDLFVEGSEGGVAVAGGTEDGVSRDSIYEVYYSFPVSRNITITPAVAFTSGDDSQTSGGVRTTFSF